MTSKHAARRRRHRRCADGGRPATACSASIADACKDPKFSDEPKGFLFTDKPTAHK